MTWQTSAWTLTPIATTGGLFTDFAPYVAAVGDDGLVVFQAGLAGPPEGHSGVFSSDGRTVTTRADTQDTRDGGPRARRFASHPAVNRAGLLAVYADLGAGPAGLLCLPPGDSTQVPAAEAVVDTGADTIGPLGPTMNERGEVALRGSTPGGQAWIGVWRAGHLQRIATTGATWRTFEGLPVINRDGLVAFRADLVDGRQGVFLVRDGQARALAQTGDGLRDIGRFPCLNHRGEVAFAATRADGSSALFLAGGGTLRCLLGAEAGFESFRGVLINDAGPVVFYGTPVGGRLGIYTGPDPARHRLLGLGDAHAGGTVSDFALNPVSVNARGQVAIRIALEDGRQFIVRAEPATGPRLSS